uniref:Uncharacterized protein n=1 Tax=Solanum tuberosum TaxID=4113 RepID=M1CPL9_SOLTU
MPSSNAGSPTGPCTPTTPSTPDVSNGSPSCSSTSVRLVISVVAEIPSHKRSRKDKMLLATHGRMSVNQLWNPTENSIMERTWNKVASTLYSKKMYIWRKGSQGLALYQDQNSVTSRNLYAVSDDVAEERIKLLEEEVLHMRENQERILQERLEAEVQQRVEHEVSRLRQQSDDRFKSMEERWSRMMSEMALSSRSSSNPSP